MNKIIVLRILFLILLTGIVTCWVFGTNFAEITIDYFAFFAGIFLIVEGLYKMIRTKAKFYPDQFLRVIRVVIGTCVFTIHLLQFIRDY